MLGGAARLDQLLGLLGTEPEQRPAAIRAALAARDFAAAAAEAHNLKGASGNVGALLDSEAACELEKCIIAAAPGHQRLLAAALRHLAAQVSLAQDAVAQLRHQSIAELATA